VKHKSCGDAGRNGDDSARPPIRPNAKAEYPQASPKSDFDKDQSHHLTVPGTRPQAASVDGFFHSLNPEHPNRNDGPKHGQAGNRPTSHVNCAIRFRPVHHGIVPVRHDCLLSLPPFDIRSVPAAQGSMAVARAAAPRFRDRAATKLLFLASEPRFWICVWRTMPLALRTGAWAFHRQSIFDAGSRSTQAPAAFCLDGSAEVGQQDLLSLDRPKAIEILIQHSQHAQQDFFVATS
jgi:hypothetical protein